MVLTAYKIKLDCNCKEYLPMNINLVSEQKAEMDGRVFIILIVDLMNIDFSETMGIHKEMILDCNLFI